jgi:hypothetical protein
MSLRTYDVEVFLQAVAFDRLWGAAMAGVHIDDLTLPTNSPGTTLSIGIGLEAGIDLLRFGEHRLGGFLRIDGTLGSDTGYSAITFGAAYRL